MTDITAASRFFTSPQFHHGLYVAHSLDDAIEQIEEAKQFYPVDLFCGSLKQIKRVRHEHEPHFPYLVDLRAHPHGASHGWDRVDGNQLGQSLIGHMMSRDTLAMLVAQAEGLAMYENEPANGRCVSNMHKAVPELGFGLYP